MATTSSSGFTGSFISSGLTTVYTASSYTEVAGWNTHQFSTPFTWNGTSNVVVDICFWNGAYTYTYSALTYYTTTSFSSCIYTYQDAASSCGTTTGTVTTNRPNMRLMVLPASGKTLLRML